MKLPIAGATGLMLLLATSADAQKIRLKEGGYDALKGTTSFNVRYDYSGMTVTTKDVPEATFVSDKKDELNAKESGRGTTWASSWTSDRERRFEPQFKEEFEKQSRFSLAKGEAKYTIVFHTVHTETGFNIGITRRNAYIDAQVQIVETANPGNVVASFTIDNAPGKMPFGMDFDTGGRLAEAYAKAGKEFGQLLRKKI